MDSKIRSITITLSTIFALISYGVAIYYKNGELIEIVSIGIITMTVTLLWLSVEHFFWKLPYIGKLLYAKPNISGVWKGRIYNHQDEESHEAKLLILQTWTTLNVITNSERADSTSIVATIKPTTEDAAFYNLIFNWSADSKKTKGFNGKGSFYGTSILKIDGSRRKIKGHYFTSLSPEQTKGELEFEKETNKSIQRG